MKEFTYTVNYNFNNVPYEFEKNVMLTDPIDYRLEVVSHSATGPEGQAWKTRVVEQADSDGNMRSVVVADVPSEQLLDYEEGAIANDRASERKISSESSK